MGPPQGPALHAVLLVASVLLAGCPFLGPICDFGAPIEATVEGVEGELTGLALVRHDEATIDRQQAEVSVMTSCAIPRVQPIPVEDGVPGTAEVDVQRYHEIRVTTTEGVVRIAAVLPRAENGSMALDVDLRDRSPSNPTGGLDPLVVWQNRTVDTRFTEVHRQPGAVDDLEIERHVELRQAAPAEVSFPVNATWNAGASLRFSVDEARELAPNASALRVGTLELVDPNGTVTDAREVTLEPEGWTDGNMYGRNVDARGGWTARFTLEEGDLEGHAATLSVQLRY